MRCRGLCFCASSLHSSVVLQQQSLFRRVVLLSSLLRGQNAVFKRRQGRLRLRLDVSRRWLSMLSRAFRRVLAKRSCSCVRLTSCSRSLLACVVLFSVLLMAFLTSSLLSSRSLGLPCPACSRIVSASRRKSITLGLVRCLDAPVSSSEAVVCCADSDAVAACWHSGAGLLMLGSVEGLLPPMKMEPEVLESVHHADTFNCTWLSSPSIFPSNIWIDALASVRKRQGVFIAANTQWLQLGRRQLIGTGP